MDFSKVDPNVLAEYSRCQLTIESLQNRLMVIKQQIANQINAKSKDAESDNAEPLENNTVRVSNKH